MDTNKLPDGLNDLINKQVVPKVEKVIQEEVAKALKSKGINKRTAGREHGNQGLSFVEGNDVRRRIGTLNTTRIKDGQAEQIRVKLNGLQDRRGRSALDRAELKAILSKALQNRLR